MTASDENNQLNALETFVNAARGIIGNAFSKTPADDGEKIEAAAQAARNSGVVYAPLN